MSTAPVPQKSGSVLLKILKWLFILLIVAVAIIVCIGLFALPGSYDLSREIIIKAPPAEVHKQVGDLREWKNWLPFIKEDPSINNTIVQPTGPGANQHWTGNGGTGKLKFDKSDEEKGIAYTMVFDDKWTSHGELVYEKAGEDTKVTWRMHGKNDDFVGKWMAAAMPAMVGPAFERGLKDLKEKVEKDKAAAKPAGEAPAKQEP